MSKELKKNQWNNNSSLSPEKIMEMALAFQRSRILLTAFELDIFTIIGDKKIYSSDVANALGINEKAINRLMNALCAIDLLIKKDERFSNTPLSSTFLVKGKPAYMAGLMHSIHLWDTWSTLTEAVQEGKSVIDQKLNDRGDEWLSAFISAMHGHAYMQAPGIVALLDLAGVKNVLDIGGGSAAYSMAFVRAKKDIKATVFDLPNVIPLTKKYIDQEGLLYAIQTVEGDYNIDGLGNGFDIIFLSAIIHINSFKENSNLIKKAYKSLNPGGQIVILDFIMDEDRTTPVFGALFSLNMLVSTKCGDTYTESEVKGWLMGAGLTDVYRKDTEAGTSLIIGRK
ncbi:MAG: methyltransferase [Spirochaetota bacterium]|nr:methyltransferase [Spirochaetota bacterium]